MSVEAFMIAVFLSVFIGAVIPFVMDWIINILEKVFKGDKK